jgi:hypothetical protein
MEPAEIVFIDPISVRKGVPKRTDWVVGKELATSAGRARRKCVPLENLETRITKIHEANVVLVDNLSARDRWMDRIRSGQVHEGLKCDQLFEPFVETHYIVLSDFRDRIER